MENSDLASSPLPVGTPLEHIIRGLYLTVENAEWLRAGQLLACVRVTTWHAFSSLFLSTTQLIMPPRRSTRSVTVEPEPKPSTSGPKRKRSQVPADVKENVVPKPTRSSIGPSSKGRTSTRPRVSLKEGEASDGEDDDEEGVKAGEDSPPPVKKSRPSPEVEDSEDSEDDDDLYAEEGPAVKPKGRKSAVKKEKDDDSDEEWDALPKAKATSKGRKSTSKPKPVPARKSNSRKPKLPNSEEDDDEAGMDVSEGKPVSKARPATSKAPPPPANSAR